MSGYGNRAWRRAGLAIPDTRTQTRVDVVGVLRSREWRQETPLKREPERVATSSSGWRYYVNHVGGQLMRFADGRISEWTGELTGTFSVAPHAIDWEGWLQLGRAEQLTEAEARIRYPEAFPVIYYQVDRGWYLFKYENGRSYYQYNRRNGWVEYTTSSANFPPFDPQDIDERINVFTEEEARQHLPEAFA